MVDADCIPDLETRKKNQYEYFPCFPRKYTGNESNYQAAVDRHALMFPERPRIRRVWSYRKHNPPSFSDEYFRPGKARYPVLVNDPEYPKYDPTVVPRTEIRLKNRLEYFPDFSEMNKEEFENAVKEHAKLWPLLPPIIKIRELTHDFNSWDEEKVIYKGDPYPVLIAPW